MANSTFLLLKGPDNVSYLASPYPEAYCYSSNGRVFSSCCRSGEGKQWWVKPFMYPGTELFHWSEYGIKLRAYSGWWNTEVEKSQDRYNWEWDGGLIFSNLSKFTVIAEASGEINPNGVYL